jgi:putative transposase
LALARRRPATRLIFHLDRGIQYTDRNIRKLCTQHRILRSISRKCDRKDNVVTESFFKTLKIDAVWGFRCLS